MTVSPSPSLARGLLVLVCTLAFLGWCVRKMVYTIRFNRRVARAERRLGELGRSTAGDGRAEQLLKEEKADPWPGA